MTTDKLNQEQELFHSFIEETKTNIEKIEENILALEKNPENAGSINDMLAQLHNIKGGAKLLGLKEVNELCHATESLMVDIKSRKIPFDRARVEILFEVEDILKKLIETLAEKLSGKKEGGPISLNSEAMIKPVIQKLGKNTATTNNEQPAAPLRQAEEENSVAAQDNSPDNANQVEQGKTSFSGKFLTFRLANEYYALAIEFVEDIISMLDITPVPQTANFVKGLINLRGKVIPVLDLRLMFEMSKKEYHKETCIIIVKGGKGLIGVIVDVVSDVIDVNDTEIEKAPDFGESIDTNFILGMCKKNNNVKILIDIEKILGNDTMVVG